MLRTASSADEFMPLGGAGVDYSSIPIHLGNKTETDK